MLYLIQHLIRFLRESVHEKKRGPCMKEKLKTAFSTRQYMIAGDFEIYYYRDRGLPEVNSHRHDYYEYYFFLEGDVSIEIETRTFRLHPGDVILIPPGVRHHAVIHSNERSYGLFVFWISRTYYEHLTSQSKDYDYLVTHIRDRQNHIFHTDSIEFNGIQSRLFRLIEENHSQRFGKQTMLANLISDLLLHLNRLVYEKDHPGRKEVKESLYSQVVRYIDGHLSDPLSLDSIASAFFVSKYHVSHVFKENIGMSVHQYITKKRLGACREAILGNAEISSVYRQYGFQDYTSFFRAFKKEYGCSPSTYRQSRTGVSERV